MLAWHCDPSSSDTGSHYINSAAKECKCECDCVLYLLEPVSVPSITKAHSPWRITLTLRQCARVPSSRRRKCFNVPAKFENARKLVRASSLLPRRALSKRHCMQLHGGLRRTGRGATLTYPYGIMQHTRHLQDAVGDVFCRRLARYPPS